MKFYVVVNFYLVSLSFKFHKDMCTLAIKREHTRLQLLRAYLCTNLLKFET